MFIFYPTTFYYPFFIPKIPAFNEQPPTLYAIMQSLVNYRKR